MRRLSDNQILPLEAGTTYALELQIAGVATGSGGATTTSSDIICIFFSTVPATSVVSVSPTEAIAGGSPQPVRQQVGRFL
ncbi:MAG: hypothetical protein RMI34_00435 [Chloroherpetonaceae bacterium]|nr:hypothetical protein [Chloroherpetonaceae bacterium]